MNRLTIEQISHAFHRLLSTSTITNDDTSFVVYHLDAISQRIQMLQNTFPKDTLHAVAINANPLRETLRFIRERYPQLGAEVASLPEVQLALDVGFPPQNIVFDSPAKTYQEIEFALNQRIHINADTFAELNRIQQLVSAGKPPAGQIGIRVNPQVGSGKIKATSVAAEYSKFGVPLNQYRADLVAMFKKFSWLTGVHVHIGSQGCDLEMLINGARIVFDFVTEINSLTRHQIEIFDIGGGLPVQYQATETPPTIPEYYSELQKEIPAIFSGRYKLITEFGRYVYANSGWAASRVEYVKRVGTQKIAVIHLGADMFLRKSYNLADWHHDITVVDSQGAPKAGVDTTAYAIAGPLCFAGDIIARSIKLPLVNEGDYIIIHDVGAYTLSMWPRYNSRQMPSIIGFSEKENKIVPLKSRESVQNILDYWM